MKLPLLILVKPYKEVIKISKFFKQGTKLIEKKGIGKLYAQVLSPKTWKILKIKKIFLKLLANKIDNIYKIVNRDNKLKQKLNTRYSDNQEDSNLTIILPTQNGDFHLTILYLLLTLQYLISTFKPKSAQLSRIVKKRRTLLLN